tara:strand:+ start:69 stop:1505 length:1437 start_codon:yes stop_codon:yes gene_type:complete
MKTFEKFTKEIYESDIILSEARSILVEKDSDALKQYKASKKSFQKGFGKNIKPTVVQPGLDLYKAGGPYVPDKTTFKDTGKKVPKMEPKPQFGTPKTSTKSGAPDRTLVKKAISDVKDSEKRLFDKGLGKGSSGIKGVKGKPGISLARQRKYTIDKIKELSAKTTQSDARMRGSSTEGTAGAGGSSKTTKPKVTPTKGVNQADVSKKAQEFTQKTNQARIEKTSTPKTTLFSKVKPKGDGKVKNSKGVGNMFRGSSPEAKAARAKAIADRGGTSSSPVVVKPKVTGGEPRKTDVYTNQSGKIPKSKKTDFYKAYKEAPRSRNRMVAKTKLGNTVTRSGATKYAKTAVPDALKRGFKGSAGKRAAIGKGAKLLKKAAIKNPLGALGLGLAGLYFGSKALKSEPKDTLTIKDFTKLNKMPGRSSKGITKKDGSEVRRDFFMTKKQKEDKVKRGEDIISTNRKVREKNFTNKLRSGEYRTP